MLCWISVFDLLERLIFLNDKVTLCDDLRNFRTNLAGDVMTCNRFVNDVYSWNISLYEVKLKVMYLQTHRDVLL